MTTESPVRRDLGMIEFHKQPACVTPGLQRWLARSQNFVVEWAEAAQGAAPFSATSAHEIMVLAFFQPASLTQDGRSVDAPARSVCIMPAGTVHIELTPGASCAVLASDRSDLGSRPPLNHGDFLDPDPRIVPSTPAWRRRADTREMHVLQIDDVAAPADNPRLKMLQTETLSINWVEYDGARDRRSLSPHSHADLEQGSLAVAGSYVHHLRKPWGRNADLWRDDRHIAVGSPSLMVVPVELIHTSEGVGAGPHLLIDMFSPPRTDFIAKGWVANSADYAEPEAASHAVAREARQRS